MCSSALYISLCLRYWGKEWGGKGLLGDTMVSWLSTGVLEALAF